MCGISGIFSDLEIDKASILNKMNYCQRHRGPDYNEFYECKEIGLGHTRLSIIDLSSDGNQPMFSSDKRYVLVFNGEIYNFKKLRKKIDYQFISNSDSEVVLASFLKWGKDCLKYLNGMFSFAIWDNVEKQLFIARDRMGIKPLYYYHDKNRFIFSSEIRAILSSNLVKKKLSRSSLVEYLKYQTVQNSKTIIQNIYSVPPASYSIIKKELNLSFHKYWNISDIKPKTLHDNENDIKNKVFSSLKSSVSKRMFSDVDSGVFLSGGLDSSILVGLMRSISNKQINTFNVSFDETEFSESKYAKLLELIIK